MFQNLFHLHREFAFDEVIKQEQRIAELFQYRPTLLPNIEQLRATLSVKSTPNKSFSNRADINAFQHKTETSLPRIPSPVPSNEIDLTKFIRDTQPNPKSTQFKFSQLAQHSQPSKSLPLPTRKSSFRQTIPCNDALLSAANKRFVLLFNINHPVLLHVFDMNNNQTKEYQWDEGVVIEIDFFFSCFGLMNYAIISLEKFVQS